PLEIGPIAAIKDGEMHVPFREVQMATTIDCPIPLAALRTARSGDSPKVLLIGPYDPMGGEYTFLAPPLGVWRLAGFLHHHEVDCEVFDPNCCSGPVEDALTSLMKSRHWDVV